MIKYQLSVYDFYHTEYYLIDTNINVVFKEQLNGSGEVDAHQYINENIRIGKILSGTSKDLFVLYPKGKDIFFFKGVSLLPRSSVLSFHDDIQGKEEDDVNTISMNSHPAYIEFYERTGINVELLNEEKNG